MPVAAGTIEREMGLRRYADVGDFLEAASPFLAAREAEHNLILGIAANLRDGTDSYDAPPYLATVSAGDRIVAVALQTPPHNLVLSEIDDPAAIALLADDLADRDLPGALGPVDHVRAFVDARVARGGSPGRLHISERIFRLTAVRPMPARPGRMRPATTADREFVIDWLAAFLAEALEPVEPSEAADLADRWIARQGRTLYLWEDGEVVSLAGIGSPTPNGIRVGPVYTPPELRRRGYASALVAAMSQAALDDGRRFCFLFTNLANPTANHIYQVHRLRAGARRRPLEVRLASVRRPDDPERLEADEVDADHGDGPQRPEQRGRGR